MMVFSFPIRVKSGRGSYSATYNKDGTRKMTTDTKIQGNDSLQQMVSQSRDQPEEGAVSSSIPLSTIILDRDNNLSLQFEGRLIGQNSVYEGSLASRGTWVSIYITKGGKIVTHVHQWQGGSEPGELGYGGRNRSRDVAGVHVDPQQALAWLIRDGGGILGSASREAWTKACRNWPPFKGHDVEIID